MTLDPYYTPQSLAERLVSFYNGRPKRIADFCAGEGRLLLACEEKFPHAQYVAVDKSHAAIRKLRPRHSGWSIYEADFLNDEQLGRCEFNDESFDLVMLNPPFSCRGNLFKFELDGFAFSASKALLFLARALRFVRKGGHLLAILPVGVVNSQRDSLLLAYLKKAYGFKVCNRVSNVSFRGKEPNVILVSLQRPKVLPKYRERALNLSVPSWLHRGCCNVISANKNAVRSGLVFVHTTNLQDGRLKDLTLRISPKGHRILTGPAVLLPRVGNPNEGKFVIVPTGMRLVLSDCVIAILCKNNKTAQKVKKILLTYSVSLFKLYLGTGARYITLSCLGHFLESRIMLDLLRVS